MSDEDKSNLQGPVFTNPSKKYGLSIRNNHTKPGVNLLSGIKSTQSKTLVKPCIFDEDEDDEETNLKDTNAKKPLVALTTSNRLKKQTQIEIEKAVKEDATVFEYDAIYDDLEKEKQKLDPKLKNDSKEPKYIAGIMKAAARRQMEFEKVQERKIQKEREEEGDMWADKEVFVTSAYRKKMEERQKLEEEERRQDQIESLLDVRKAKDLAGFYSNMLKMRSGEFVIHEESEKQKLVQKEEKLEKLKELDIKKPSQQKSYRTKREESSESEDETEQVDKQQDKDQHISDDDKQKQQETESDENPKELKQEKLDETDSKKLEIKIEIESLKQEIELEKNNQLNKEDKETRRLNMFKKRTVGDKFDQELSDYFVRKSTILCLKNHIEKE